MTICIYNIYKFLFSGRAAMVNDFKEWLMKIIYPASNRKRSIHTEQKNINVYTIFAGQMSVGIFAEKWLKINGTVECSAPCGLTPSRDKVNEHKPREWAMKFINHENHHRRN